MIAGPYCGVRCNLEIFTDLHRVQIRFRTDGSVTKAGFLMNYGIQNNQTSSYPPWETTTYAPWEYQTTGIPSGNVNSCRASVVVLC